MLEEQELIVQILQGNQQAYAQIIDRYKSRLYAVLIKMVGQPQDAQDMLQEVFIKIYYKLNEYSPTGKFSAWIYRIAINHCLDELRRRKRELPNIPISDSDHPHDDTPEKLYLEKEQAAAFQKILLSLPEDYRIVLLLRHSEQLSYREISETLMIPVNTVQVRLHRARKKFQECWLKRKEGGGVYEMYPL
ncbi:RNA polymerase sigma factor [Brevibacillus sp. B_LB10_24]|uniref:RNA polymerase sigma factor n=1 Tax=Brevibacillus sp. B_LB10_24 TaxID=3380645 RepID=UPI0038B98B8A